MKLSEEQQERAVALLRVSRLIMKVLDFPSFAVELKEFLDTLDAKPTELPVVESESVNV